jgi:hypothetical protein
VDADESLLIVRRVGWIISRQKVGSVFGSSTLTNPPYCDIPIPAVRKTASFLWLTAAGLLSLAGLALFVWLFVPNINVYWFILSPVIFSLYQVPAVIVIAIWKRKRRKTDAGDEPRPENDQG